MENKTANKRYELSMEELDKINGGLVVYRGLFDKCWVVNDQTGAVIGKYSFEGDAKWAAGSKGVSTEVISEKEYYKRFGK